jgi:hypothetical protein
MRLLNAVSDTKRLELRSFARALTAHVFEQVGRGPAETTLRKTWQHDERSMLLLRSAVAPTSRADYPMERILGVFRSLAPTAAS